MDLVRVRRVRMPASILRVLADAGMLGRPPTAGAVPHVAAVTDR